MRLLILSQYFWPETFRINDLTSELIARGHDVTVLTGQPNYPGGSIYETYRSNPAEFGTFEGAPVVRVPVIPRGKNNLQLFANYVSFILSGTLLGPAKLRGRQFDAIFVFQTSPITSALPAVWLRRRHRAPLLLWVLDLWPGALKASGVVKSPWLIDLVGRLVGFIYRRCDAILVQSKAFCSDVAKRAGGNGKIRYFPGWPETVFAEAEANAETAPELAPYTGDFKLLFAGNIGQPQDFPSIIAAADLLRDEPGLRWIILGDGRVAAAAKAEVARLGLEEKVLFLGRFPLERMPSFFAAADALLVSLRDEPIWSMTIPGKVQTYLASGKPLIAMMNGEGARVIEESGGGLVAPAGDSAALARNIRRLIAASAEERRMMGKSAQAYCKREFDRSALVDKLEDWIRVLSEENAR